MIEIAKGYDSWVDIGRCDWCRREIGPSEPKVLFGTGNSLAAIYHLACYTQSFQKAVAAKDENKRCCHEGLAQASYPNDGWDNND